MPAIAIISLSHVSGRAEGKIYFSPVFRLCLCDGGSAGTGSAEPAPAFPGVCVGLHMATAERKAFLKFFFKNFYFEDEKANVIVRSSSNLQGRARRGAGAQTGMGARSVLAPLRFLLVPHSPAWGGCAPRTPRNSLGRLLMAKGKQVSLQLEFCWEFLC